MESTFTIRGLMVKKKKRAPAHLAHDDKLRELMLYVASRSEKDPRFSAVKLNKILFFAEFTAFGRLGKTITGHAYQKLQWGPAPRKLKPIQNRMIRDKSCAIQQREYYGRTQDRLVALREPDLSVFTAEEIAIVDDILERTRRMNATEVSDKSHEFIGWNVAELGEDILPETVFLVPQRPLTKRERRFALTLTPSRG